MFSDSCFVFVGGDGDDVAEGFSSRPIALDPGLQGLKHENYKIRRMLSNTFVVNILFIFL